MKLEVKFEAPRRTALIVAAVFALALSLRSQEGGAPPSAQSQTPAQKEIIERGRKEFIDSCSFCHAEDATGGMGPDLIRSKLVRHDKDGDLIGPVVSQGRPDRGMPALGLPETQLADIVAFLHAQIDMFDLHTRVPGAYPNDIPAERLATGDVNAGKAYFDANCSKCHSPTGDLKGVAGKYTPPDLQSRFLYPYGKLPNATVTPPSGKPVSGVLLLMDDFNVAIRDTEGWYHCWPRSEVKVDVQDPLAAHIELLHKYTDADMHNLFTYLETLK